MEENFILLEGEPIIINLKLFILYLFNMVIRRNAKKKKKMYFLCIATNKIKTYLTFPNYSTSLILVNILFNKLNSRYLGKYS